MTRHERIPLPTEAILRANLKRALKRLEEWSEHPRSNYRKASFLDALSHCIDSDLADETRDALWECGLDREGYPLDQYGDRDTRRERAWVPHSEKVA